MLPVIALAWGDKSDMTAHATADTSVNSPIEDSLRISANTVSTDCPARSALALATRCRRAVSAGPGATRCAVTPFSPKAMEYCLIKFAKAALPMPAVAA